MNFKDLKISENIIYTEDILKSNNSKFYEKQLKIVSLNLDDFNSRFDSQIKLTYNPIWNTFMISSKYETYASVFVRNISHYLLFYNDDDWEEDNFLNKCFELMQFPYDNLYSTIFDDKQKEWENDDAFVRELNLFLNRYDNYHPLGVLSDSGEKEFKYRAQKLVDSLKSIIH